MRASPARSIRTLREGIDLALDFGMDDVLSCVALARLPPKPFTNKLKRLHIRINTGFWNRHELSIVVFAAQARSLSAQAPPRVGAVDAHAGGQAFARAAAVERGILRPARDAGRIAHRRSLACHGNGLRQPRRARHLYRAADRWLARGGRCRSRQGRRDLPAALACRTRFPFLVPARRRAAGRAIGGADRRTEDRYGRWQGGALRDAAGARDLGNPRCDRRLSAGGEECARSRLRRRRDSWRQRLSDRAVFAVAHQFTHRSIWRLDPEPRRAS